MIGAILLTTLSLLLSGCGSINEPSTKYTNDTTPPSAPSGLTATATSSSTVSLGWTASTDSTDFAGYQIYRKTGSGNYTLIATVWNAVGYTDAGVAPGTAYTYEVIAFDAANNLSAASTVSVTTPAPGALLHSVSGRVTYNGLGISGVTLNIIGTGYGSATTDQNGYYSFPQVMNGSYSIIPSLAGNLFFPASQSFTVVDANITLPDFVSDKPGSLTGGTTYPDGTVIVTTTSPDGTVIVTATYPDGTVVVTTTYPDGTVIVTTTYPDGTIIVTATYPDGTVVVTTTYPTGTVTVTTTYPNGTVTITTTYPNGTVTTSTTYPDGTVTTFTTYPDGTVTLTTTYPIGTVTTTTTYPTGTVNLSLTYV